GRHSATTTTAHAKREQARTRARAPDWEGSLRSRATTVPAGAAKRASQVTAARREGGRSRPARDSPALRPQRLSRLANLRRPRPGRSLPRQAGAKAAPPSPLLTAPAVKPDASLAS